MPWWVDKAEKLWPRSIWTDEIRRLWSERLRNAEPEVLSQCLDNVRCDRSSERVEIAWVLAALAEHKANQRRSMAAVEPREDPEERMRRERVEADDESDRMRADLESLPEQELDSLRDRVRLSFPALRMSGPVRGWSRMSVGLVHAIGVTSGSWSTPSLAPSLGSGPSSATARSASTDPPRPPSSSTPSGSPPGRASDARSPDPADFW